MGRIRLITAVGAAAVMAASFPSVALPVLAGSLIHDLALSRAQFGTLLTLFAAVGVIAAAEVGKRADTYGPRATLLWLFGLAGLGLGALGSSRGFLTAAAAVAISGVANVLDHAPMNTLIARAAPTGKRGLPMGVKASGAQMGALLAGILLPFGEARVGWRLTLALMASAIAVGGLLLVYVAVPRREGSREPTTGSTGTLRNRDVAWLVASAALVAAGSSAVVGFLPLYAQDVGGMSAATTGALISVAGLVGIAGRIGWSWIGERGVDSAGSLAVLAFTSTSSVAALLVAPRAGPWAYWVAAFAAGATMLAWPGIGMLAVVVEVPQRVAGHATGLVLRGFLAGWAVSPVLFGAFVDATDSYALAWTAVGLTFIAGGVIPLATPCSARRWDRADWPESRLDR